MEPSPSDSDHMAKNPRAQRAIKRDGGKQKSGKSDQRQASTALESKSSAGAGAGAGAGQVMAAAIKTATGTGTGTGDAPLDIAALMERPFAWPPTKEDDEIINSVLYGPSSGTRRRLPVFKKICPD